MANLTCILFTVGTTYILKKGWLSLTTDGVLFFFAQTQNCQISDFAARGEFASLLTKATHKFTKLLPNYSQIRLCMDTLVDVGCVSAVIWFCVHYAMLRGIEVEMYLLW